MGGNLKIVILRFWGWSEIHKATTLSRDHVVTPREQLRTGLRQRGLHAMERDSQWQPKTFFTTKKRRTRRHKDFLFFLCGFVVCKLKVPAKPAIFFLSKAISSKIDDPACPL